MPISAGFGARKLLKTINELRAAALVTFPFLESSGTFSSQPASRRLESSGTSLGIHSVRAILDDKPLKGLWFNQTQEYAARNRGEEFDRLKYATEEELVLTQLPCWELLSREAYRDRIASLVEEAEADARAKRDESGIPPFGVAEVLKQSQHSRPNQTKRSPAPRFHAVAKHVRDGMWSAYVAFVVAFREAAEKLKAGDRLASFPIGSFPPRLPFVSACPAMPP